MKENMKKELFFWVKMIGFIFVLIVIICGVLFIFFLV